MGPVVCLGVLLDAELVIEIEAIARLAGRDPEAVHALLLRTGLKALKARAEQARTPVPAPVRRWWHWPRPRTERLGRPLAQITASELQAALVELTTACACNWIPTATKVQESAS